jgi:recombination protein RecT
MNAPMNTNPTAKLPLRQVQNVRELLINENARGQLAKVAAKHMNPERMMRVVANAIRTTPQLADCDPMSMLGALMTAASLGLEPNTPLGHAYLIPFKNNKKGLIEVQFIIGYKGFADLARRSGQIVSLHADVVYSDDEMWSFEYGSDMHLRHKPGPRKGKKTHAYCHVTLKDGQAFIVLPWEQVIATRDKSQGWQSALRFNKTASSPWSTHEDRMGAKTAVRALANAGEMPLSIEFLEAVDSDERVMSFDLSSGMAEPTGEVIEGEAAETYDAETGEVTRQIEQDRGPELEKVNAAQQRSAEPVSARKAMDNLAPKAFEQRQATTEQGQTAEREEEPAQEQQQLELTREALPDDQAARKVDRAQFQTLFDHLVGEIESAGAEAVEELYGEQLAHMRHAVPELYTEIAEKLDQAKAA